MKQLLINAVANIEEEKALYLARKMLDEGHKSVEVINAVQEGMQRIGILFEKSEYYIADLMMAGILFKEILQLPGMTIKLEERDKGVLMVATVEGDLHDIGRNIFAEMARGAGFKVINLGMDVKSSDIVSNIQKYRPDILGLSAILTSSIDVIKHTTDQIKALGLNDDLKIVVGGYSVKNFNLADLGIDYIARDAMDGVRIIKQWMSEKDKF